METVPNDDAPARQIYNAGDDLSGVDLSRPFYVIGATAGPDAELADVSDWMQVGYITDGDDVPAIFRRGAA